jgi:signal transduction histidine kinase
VSGLVKIFLLFVLIISSVISSSGDELPKNIKNVLLINSYHQGYTWTDSLTSGIITTLKLHPGINFFTQDLNSKQLGQSNFEYEKNHIRSKFEGISFDGIIVTDNDALNFALQYNDFLFPGKPVVFAGISNPEAYPLEGSMYYGYKETVNTRPVCEFVRKILPESRRLLVLTDLTTTGKIYRKELTNLAANYNDLSVFFPEVIDLDSIYKIVSSEKKYDAIYYIGINQDKYGRSVDFASLLDTIVKLAKVPVFNNDPLFNGIGVMGGLYQSGKKHGSAAANLLIQLMDSTRSKPSKRIAETGSNYYFDKKVLDKFQIPLTRIPAGSTVINAPKEPNKKTIVILGIVLIFLILIILFLYNSTRRMKKAEQKIRSQFKMIRTQNEELTKTHDQLSSVITELAATNERLTETNKSLSEAKKKAEESDNLKSAFLANVSHEIRTPLNSIVGFSSLLGDSDLTQETKNSYIELIESNTESLLVLIDEIIDLSKIEAQQLTLKKQEFSIDELLSELFRVFSHSHQHSKVDLRIRKIADSKELIIYSDRVRVNQIFVNLISNAYKFTDSGFIEFGYFEAKNNEIQLFVRDSGIGIKEEYHQVIFERFRKLNTEDRKLYRGTGLGLAITQKLVQLLGGEIWVESESGKGTVFIFTLDGIDLKDITT